MNKFSRRIILFSTTTALISLVIDSFFNNIRSLITSKKSVFQVTPDQINHNSFNIGSEFVNVKDFGAKGNGVEDDTVAFQNAINSASFIFIPEGIYSVSTIKVGSEKKLVCDGIIKLLFTENPYFFDCSNSSNIEFNGLYFDGNKVNFQYDFVAKSSNAINSRSRYSPIFGINCSNISVKNCTFNNCYSAGIYLKGSIDKKTEKAVYNSIKIIGCTYTNGYFELAKIIEMDDINILGNHTKENRNNSGNIQLVGNGFITTRCSNVIVKDNYFGSSQGNGFKAESINGFHLFENNYCEQNDFIGIGIQESATEVGYSRKDKIVVRNNLFKQSLNYGFGSESSTLNAPENIVIENNIFDSCVLGGVVVSGKNTIITNNQFIGNSIDRNGSESCPYGILINGNKGNKIENIIVSNNTFANMFVKSSTKQRPSICIGYKEKQNMIVRNINIYKNDFNSQSCRGVFCQNNIDISEVFILDNKFRKRFCNNTIRHGKYDVYAFNSQYVSEWSVKNNTCAYGISIRLIHNESTLIRDNNVVCELSSY